jgi:uncharacterized SAM-binding protein YcdF (DUF218 family)
MIYFYKLAPYIFYPITLILGLMIWGFLSRKRLPLLMALSLFWFCSTPYISNAFVIYLEQGQMRKKSSDIVMADVVVVLGGMLVRVNSAGGPMYEWKDPDRFLAGLEMMKAHKARYLLLTSGKYPWDSAIQLDNANLSEGQYLAKFANEYGIALEQIHVSQEVQNTDQEAKAVKEFLQKNDLHNIILITSNFHMERAKEIFEWQGIDVQTYPVDSRIGLASMTPMNFLPDARAFSETQFALHELMGRTFYRIKTMLSTR